MKIKSLFTRLITLAAGLALIGTSSSCMTTYDAYGRPYQSVDPALAVAGIAAAGLIGYAAGNDHGGRHRSEYYNSGGYSNGGRYYGGGGYSRSGRVRSR